MSVTHLAMILSCSRPQYLRMENGENRFKDEQLALLAALYGENVSIYKDMQDLDYLLKKIGYNDNQERDINLLNLALKAITITSETDPTDDKISPEIKEKLFNLQPISKEIHHQKMAEIIENNRSRYQQNELKMGEIREIIAPMTDTPNPKKLNFGNSFTGLKTNKSPLIG